jgi:release factor glutamine methyltransferase
MTGGTVAEHLARTARRLAGAGIEDARREARLLVEAALDIDAAAVVGHPERSVVAGDVARLDAMAARRAARVPMSQVLGRREFWSLDFAVTADTLAPRPDSETLVEAALEHGRDGARVLDLGTGTGCLLLALLASWPGARGVGVDRSPAALAVARLNAERLGLAARTRLLVGDWCASLSGRFDVIVANPPYICSSEIAGLEPEVAHHEPRLALDGGADGLDAYHTLLPQIGERLVGNGIAVLEHGAGQGELVAALAQQNGLIVQARRADLSGRLRCLVLAPGHESGKRKNHLE